MEKVKVLDQSSGKNWKLFHGDVFEVIRGIPDNSLGYGVTSPPFSSLYTYSATERDAGNCKDDEEFFEHFQYLISELYRTLKPGRLFSMHCMQLPSTKQHHGYIGLRDFRGDLIRAFLDDEAADFYAYIKRLKDRQIEALEDDDTDRVHRLDDMIIAAQSELAEYPGRSGFIFHSEVCIWKDPLIAATRTHAIGLAHKQIVKDSSLCRQGIADYLVTMRKPGDNEEAIAHPDGFTDWIGDPHSKPKAARQSDQSKNKFSHHVWQRYASPVWMDINPSNTLQYQSAREEGDLKHICCLQLDVIERGIELWSNPGDVVIDPFNGIGSTGYVAIKKKRQYVGVELKPTYYQQAVRNLTNAEQDQPQSLLDLLEVG